MKAAVIAAVLLIASGSAADDIALPKTKAVLHLPSGWTKLETTAVVAAYRSPSGLALAVSRAQVPNPDAWRDKTRSAYADQVERGAVGAVADQRRIARKLGEANGIPALDLELRRRDGTTLVLRILLFRSYALAVTLEVPKGGSLDEARGVTTLFAPPAPPAAPVPPGP